MLADEPDQRDEPDLRIDVDRRQPKEQRHHRAADRHRHADKDHERVTQALELRRQHEKDDDQREHKGDEELVALLHILPRIRQVIVAEP